MPKEGETERQAAPEKVKELPSAMEPQKGLAEGKE